MHNAQLNNPRTSFAQKIILVTAGILLGIVLLEISLRLSGFLIISIQENVNRSNLRKEGAYRIMCIGESTTAQGGEDSYPSQLSVVLNNRNDTLRFSVINEGVRATNTSVILSRLEENLKKYQPHMVIAMIGINDSGPHMPYETFPVSRLGRFTHSLKTYKLVRLLQLHILTKLRESRNCSLQGGAQEKASIEASLEEALRSEPRNAVRYINLGNFYRSLEFYAEAEKVYRQLVALNPLYDQVYLELARLYRDQMKYQQAVINYQKVAALNPANDYAYAELGRFYRDQLRYTEAEALLNQALMVNPRNSGAYRELAWFFDERNDPEHAEALYRKSIELDPQEAYAYIQLGRFYREHKRHQAAEDCFKKAIAINPVTDRMGGYIELGRLLRELKRYREAEVCFKKAIELDPKSANALAGLAVTYGEEGKASSSSSYENKVESLRLQYYNPLTQSNYRQIKKILDRYGVKLICTQYPMRGIEQLRQIFKDEAGVVFVDNEKLFKDAVKTNGYDACFIDMFGGDFGHCTKKGNRLLAENIAQAILKEVFCKDEKTR